MQNCTMARRVIIVSTFCFLQLLKNVSRNDLAYFRFDASSQSRTMRDNFNERKHFKKRFCRLQKSFQLQQRELVETRFFQISLTLRVRFTKCIGTKSYKNKSFSAQSVLSEPFAPGRAAGYELY